MKSNYRYLVPNGITMASLACGLLSLLMATKGAVRPAGMLILASYILDLLDGLSARWLQASSPFGLHLDSLSDIVSLGTAPGILVFVHLQQEGLTAAWVWGAVLLMPLAGAFRLTRFNLLPPKQTKDLNTMGLTISTAGAILTLAVLSDLALVGKELPDWSFIPLLILLSLLMVSKIAFPSFFWIFSHRWRSLILLLLFGASLLVVPVFNALFICMSFYLGLSLTRAGYKSLQRS